MAANTKIEWAHHTFNPWIGCTKISPACDHCYAEADFGHRRKVVQWGAGQPRKHTAPSTWAQPLRWNAEAERQGVRQTVFCASLADWADNEVPSEWRQELAGVISRTPWLIWLLLTKRIGNAKTMLADMFPEGVPPNVRVGATICNQLEADRDIPKLVKLGLPNFISFEPLLGPVDLSQALAGIMQDFTVMGNAYLHWVIVGGESGPKARPMHPDWARSLRDQCNAAGVPFMFKQWGNWRPAAWFDGPDADADNGDDFVDLDYVDHEFLANDGRTWDTMGGRYMYPPMPLGHWCLMVNEGKKAAGRLLDGREWNEVPT